MGTKAAYVGEVFSLKDKTQRTKARTRRFGFFFEPLNVWVSIGASCVVKKLHTERKCSTTAFIERRRPRNVQERRVRSGICWAGLFLLHEIKSRKTGDGSAFSLSFNEEDVVLY
jgi:hypothetical protein